MDAAAQQRQPDVLAERERPWSVDSWSYLSEHERLVIVLAHLGSRLNVGLVSDVQQTRCGLPNLAANEHALWAASLERHVPIIFNASAKPNGATSRSGWQNVPSSAMTHAVAAFQSVAERR